MTEGGMDPEGAFIRVCRFPDEVIQEIFTHEVFSLLLRKKLIGLPLVQKILRWRHTGFNVHSQVRTQTKKEAERVSKYMIRYHGAFTPMPTGARCESLELSGSHYGSRGERGIFLRDSVAVFLSDSRAESN